MKYDWIFIDCSNEPYSIISPSFRIIISSYLFKFSGSNLCVTDIREIRKTLKISQKYVSETTGIDDKTIGIQGPHFCNSFSPTLIAIRIPIKYPMVKKPACKGLKSAAN